MNLKVRRSDICPVYHGLVLLMTRYTLKLEQVVYGFELGMSLVWIYWYFCIFPLSIPITLHVSTEQCMKDDVKPIEYEQIVLQTILAVLSLLSINNIVSIVIAVHKQYC